MWSVLRRHVPVGRGAQGVELVPIKAIKPRPRRIRDGVPMARWRSIGVETRQFVHRKTIGVDLAKQAALASKRPRPLVLLLAWRSRRARVAFRSAGVGAPVPSEEKSSFLARMLAPTDVRAAAALLAEGGGREERRVEAIARGAAILVVAVPEV